MDQSSFSLLTPSLPSLTDAPYHHHHHHHHPHLGMNFSRDEDNANQGIVGSDNGDDDDDEFEFELRSPVSEWDEQPSSPSLVNFSPTTSHLLLASLKPTPFFKPPPPVLSPPVSKPYPTSIANLSEEEDSPLDSKSSHSVDNLEDLGTCNEKVRALREKLPTVKKCKLKDLLSRSGQDKQSRSPVPHSWSGRQGSVYPTSSPFDSGKKGMNETALGIMGIKLSPSFLHPTAPILKSSFPSPTRKVVSATSSPSRQEVFCNSKLKHQKKTELPYRQGFLGCLPFSSKFDPPVSELTAA